MARTATRHRLPSAKDTQQWRAEANEIAECERRYRRARADYLQARRRLDELRHAHAVLVDVIAKRAGIAIGTPGAVPGGLEVPGHRELVSAIHAVEPWFPPPDACVRGATIDDDPDVVRVLIALERGHTLTAACQLAMADGIARSPAGDRLRKRVERSGAYTRWREALERVLAVSAHVSVAGESRAAREHRINALRALLTLHR